MFTFLVKTNKILNKTNIPKPRFAKQKEEEKKGKEKEEKEMRTSLPKEFITGYFLTFLMNQ